MNQNEIKQVLRLHGLWIKNDPEGQKAYLTGVDLRCADLEGAILRYAILVNADLWNANLEGADLFGAIFDKETKFPEGFNPVARGMI